MAAGKLYLCKGLLKVGMPLTRPLEGVPLGVFTGLWLLWPAGFRTMMGCVRAYVTLHPMQGELKEYARD